MQSSPFNTLTPSQCLGSASGAQALGPSTLTPSPSLQTRMLTATFYPLNALNLTLAPHPKRERACSTLAPNAHTPTLSSALQQPPLAPSPQVHSVFIISLLFANESGSLDTHAHTHALTFISLLFAYKSDSHAHAHTLAPNA
jgi:hypothetical protein